MFEKLNIFTSKAMFELVQTLKDYDVDINVMISLIHVSRENIPKDKFSQYSNLIGNQIAKYDFNFKKDSFDNNNTIKIYHELNVLFKKLKSIGCDVEITETDKLIIVSSIPVNVDDLG